MNELEKRFEEMKKVTDLDELRHEIIGTCMYSGEYEYSLKVCNYFITHPSIDIRLNCITSLDIIYTVHKKMDHDIANRILNIGLKHPELKGMTEDIIGTLEHNVKNYKFKKE